MTIKRLTNELAIAGQPLNCDDIITYLFAGLGPEYDTLISMISHRDNSLTLDELFSMLLTCEARIQHHNQTLSLPMASANIATRQQYYSGGKGRNKFSAPQGRGRPQFIANCGGYRGNNHICCQLRDTPGHMASRCWKPFDPNFQTPPPRSRPQANLAFHRSQQHSIEQEWHPDTGATHHLTNNMSNLNIQSNDFSGNEQICIGDVSGLKITHTRTVSLSTSSSSFVLNNILVVPQITKNLLSVQKFAQDNNVYFEFHNLFFFIKDYSGNVLHKGFISDGLYSFSSPL